MRDTGVGGESKARGGRAGLRRHASPGKRFSQVRSFKKLELFAYPYNTARLYPRSWTEAGLATVGPLLEQTEDVTIAITPRRWSAWDIRSTFFSAVQEAGILIEDAETWVPALKAASVGLGGTQAQRVKR